MSLAMNSTRRTAARADGGILAVRATEFVAIFLQVLVVGAFWGSWIGLTPVRAPKANAVAERLVGTLRRECLDHMIVLNERHLRAILSEFVAFYNADRLHRSLDLESPRPRPRSRDGPIRVRAVLGGLHHAYERAA
jgi:hypothetical protein